MGQSSLSGIYRVLSGLKLNISLQISMDTWHFLTNPNRFYKQQTVDASHKLVLSNKSAQPSWRIFCMPFFFFFLRVAHHFYILVFVIYTVQARWHTALQKARVVLFEVYGLNNGTARKCLRITKIMLLLIDRTDVKVNLKVLYIRTDQTKLLQKYVKNSRPKIWEEVSKAGLSCMFSH